MITRISGFPLTALSVRQPWAWAIVHGFKDIENRSAGAVSLGRVRTMRISIHASKGMTRGEYESARECMADIGVTCPRPDELTRGALIGAADVVDIVSEHDSPWFFGPRGLVLANAQAAPEPRPCSGQLGYFDIMATEPGAVEAPLPWMRAWPNDRIPRGASTLQRALAL